MSGFVLRKEAATDTIKRVGESVIF